MAWLEVSTDFVLKRVSCLSLEPSPSCSLRMGFSLSSQSDIRNLKTLILLSPWFQLHVVGTGQGGASKDRWRIKDVTGVLGSTVILGNIYSFQILRASWSIILLVIPSCKSALAFVTVCLLLESQLVRNAAGGLFPRILVGRWDSATYPGGGWKEDWWRGRCKEIWGRDRQDWDVKKHTEFFFTRKQCTYWTFYMV